MGAKPCRTRPPTGEEKETNFSGFLDGDYLAIEVHVKDGSRLGRLIIKKEEIGWQPPHGNAWSVSWEEFAGEWTKLWGIK